MYDFTARINDVLGLDVQFIARSEEAKFYLGMGDCFTLSKIAAINRIQKLRDEGFRVDAAPELSRILDTLDR